MVGCGVAGGVCVSLGHWAALRLPHSYLCRRAFNQQSADIYCPGSDREGFPPRLVTVTGKWRAGGRSAVVRLCCHKKAASYQQAGLRVAYGIKIFKEQLGSKIYFVKHNMSGVCLGRFTALISGFRAAGGVISHQLRLASDPGVSVACEHESEKKKKKEKKRLREMSRFAETSPEVPGEISRNHK